MTLELRIYYDFASPFCRIALEAVDLLARQYDLGVDWRPFEVIDYLPERGAMPQNPAFVRRGEEERARKLAAQFGITMYLRDRLLNSRLALCAVQYAQTVLHDDVLADTLRRALFEAYYGEGHDLSDLDLVLAVARGAGVSDGLESALRSGAMVELVAASRASARDLGVVAVPTWIANGYGVVGVPSQAELEHFIEMAQLNGGDNTSLQDRRVQETIAPDGRR